MSNHLVLIDGHAMLYRAFFAFPKTLTTPQGEIINAAYGFTRILLSVIKELNPTHLAASFDIGKTWRHEEYPAYKAHREKMPDELKQQEAPVYQILNSFQIPTHLVEGFEADDVIGTIAKLAANTLDTSVTIVTGDMDALQLIQPETTTQQAICVFKPGNAYNGSTTYHPETVQQKYGLSPIQIIDLKALAGDSSDNIPGVKGIGPKTATLLLQEFATVENIYHELETNPNHPLFKGATAKKLTQNKAEALHSKHLVTICTNVDTHFNLEKTLTQDFNPSDVEDTFRQFGFASLLNQIPQDSFIHTVKHHLS